MGKGKEVAKEAPMNQKKCFKCYGYGHFQGDNHNRRILTIKGIEHLNQMEIKQDEEELEEEEEEEEETSYLPLEEGEMLMIKRMLHIIEALSEANKKE